MRRIGIDVGGVLMQGGTSTDGEEDTIFSPDSYTRTPAMPGMVAALCELGQSWEVFIVSKCGPKIEGRTREWFVANDFTARTGIPVDRWRFCRRRPQKAVIAAELSLGAFVDDRLDVLLPMEGIVPTLIVFGDRAPEDQVPSWIQPAPTWDAAMRILRSPRTQRDQA